MTDKIVKIRISSSYISLKLCIKFAKKILRTLYSVEACQEK